MQGQFFLVINENFHGSSHEFLANASGLFGHSCGEHANLFIVFGFDEDLLDIVSHVGLFKHFIAFVKNEEFKLVKFLVTGFREVQNTSWSTDGHVWWILSQFLPLLGDWDTSEESLCS
jgi:hypothetical protein